MKTNSKHSKNYIAMTQNLTSNGRGVVSNRGDFKKILLEISKLEIFLSSVDINLKEKNTYSREIETKVFKKLNDFFRMIDNAYKYEDRGNEFGELKKIFRKTLVRFFLKSSLLKHGYLKPRGYPGDSQILEAMYENTTATKNGIGLILDNYFLSNNYVQAVRDRKDYMKNYLTSYLENSKDTTVSILNIACGACREIRDVLKEDRPFLRNKKVNLFLVDQDQKTLDYSASRINQYQPLLSVNLIRDNISLYFERQKEIQSDFGKMNLVYSIGLADYLPDSVLGPLIKFSFGILKRKGTFIMAFKNVDEVPATAPDWICDWKFVVRSKRRVSKIFSLNLIDKKYTQRIVFGETRLIFYVIVTKNS